MLQGAQCRDSTSAVRNDSTKLIRPCPACPRFNWLHTWRGSWATSPIRLLSLSGISQQYVKWRGWQVFSYLKKSNEEYTTVIGGRFGFPGPPILNKMVVSVIGIPAHGRCTSRSISAQRCSIFVPTMGFQKSEAFRLCSTIDHTSTRSVQSRHQYMCWSLTIGTWCSDGAIQSKVNVPRPGTHQVSTSTRMSRHRMLFGQALRDDSKEL
jgi:hypothetical protein